MQWHCREIWSYVIDLENDRFWNFESMSFSINSPVQIAGACGNDEHCVQGWGATIARRWSYRLIAVCWHPTHTCSDTQHRQFKKNKENKIKNLTKKFPPHDSTCPHLSTWRSEREAAARASESTASGGRDGGRSQWIMTAASGLWEVVKQRAVNPIRMCHLWPHQSSLRRDQRADRWTCSAGDTVQTRRHSHMKMFTFRGSNLLREETAVTNLSHWTVGFNRRRILSWLTEAAPLDALECSNGRWLLLLWKSSHSNLNLDTNSSRHMNNITESVWRHFAPSYLGTGLVLACIISKYIALNEILFLYESFTFVIQMKWNTINSSVGAAVSRKLVSNQWTMTNRATSQLQNSLD